MPEAIMCGRYTLKTPASRLVEVLAVQSLPELSLRFNIAPTQQILTVRHAAGTKASREAVLMRWGLVPFWATDLKIGASLINARSETVATKPAFRAAFKKRRCLIPSDGFYEWEKTSDGRKQPWYIHAVDDEPFAMAGLWESWRPKPAADGGSGESTADQRLAGPVESASILTTTSNGDIGELHDRMPVILPIEHWAAWLNPETSPTQLESLLRPLPDGSLRRYRVSALVNRPVPDSAECVEPLDSEGPAAAPWK